MTHFASGAIPRAQNTKFHGSRLVPATRCPVRVLIRVLVCLSTSSHLQLVETSMAVLSSYRDARLARKIRLSASNLFRHDRVCRTPSYCVIATVYSASQWSIQAQTEYEGTRCPYVGYPCSCLGRVAGCQTIKVVHTLV